MSDLGRTLVLLGLFFVVAGLVLMAVSRFNLPLGRLPGDLHWKGNNWSISFPLMTSIVASLVLSLILWLINHFRR